MLTMESLFAEEQANFLCLEVHAMRRIYIFFLLLCLTQVSWAQTFYEVNYTDNGVEYLGLMIYYNDENCKMRLITQESLKENMVFESQYVNLVEEKHEEEGVGIMTYYPIEKKFPIFLWYWETDDASDISEKPYVTYNIKKTNNYIEAEYFHEIPLEEMDEEYISQYYGEDEPEYKMMLNGINIVKNQDLTHQDIEVTVDDPIFADLKTDEMDEGENIAPGESGNTLDEGNTEGSTMHLIVVANTNVSDIGSACAKDVVNLNSEFGGIAKVLGMKYAPNVIRGKNYSKENLSKLIHNFKPDSDDVVIFVYTGHGFRFDDQQDYYPNMDLSPTSYDDPKKNYVAVSDVYKELVSKGARLCLVFSDCCNNEIGETTPIVNTNTLFSRSNNNFDVRKLERLFVDASGSLIATAASPGELSWCGVNGGFFILSFLESLRAHISALSIGLPDWETLVADALTAATAKSQNNANTKAQHGMKMIRIKQ